MISVRLANKNDLIALSHLFDQYRCFYEMPSAINSATQFIEQRLTKEDSTLCVAEYQATSASRLSTKNNQTLVGFVQLYPAFTSVGMQKIWILNDLYVSQAHRQQKVAEQLLQFTEALAKEKNIFSIKLATQTKNTPAKNLYAKLGYQIVCDFEHFTKKIK